MNTLRTTRPRTFLLVVALGAVVATAILVASPTAVGAAANPGVMPPASAAFGHTYGEWAAGFWQWVLGQGLYPLVDDTGALCGAGQSGQVWFLAGTWIGDVDRACTVPSGKAVFVPVQNNVWITFPDDPPFDEAAARAGIAAALDAQGTPQAWIDGAAIVDFDQYRVQSPLFDAFIPADNAFGLPEMESGPNVDEGWYLLLAPLSVGEHEVRFTSWGSEVTYDLTVAPGS